MLFKLKIVYHWLCIQWRGSFSDRTALEQHQQKHLDAFANEVLTKSRFYAPYRVNGKFLWESVPQIAKAEFMENFDAINTCGIKKEEAMQLALEAEKSRDFKSEINGITVGLSTGTSGKRGIFLVSENERAKWTALVLSRVIRPQLFRKQKIAFFLRANSNLYASVESALFEFQYFDIFKPIETLLSELNAFKPDVVAAQPSILMDIAAGMKNKKVQISPKQIISFAEVLHESDKAFLFLTFAVPIGEVYQCTEGFLGYSCKFGTMHLNEDFIKVDKEWIEQDKFYPIITDFSRSSQPVVKYKLNDILQVKESPCPCGTSLIGIEKILGRDDDVLIFGHTKIYPDLIARRIALVCDEFSNYSIIQTGAKALEVQIDCGQNDFETLSKNFDQAIIELLNEFAITGVKLNYKHQVMRNPGSKHRKIMRSTWE